jgi:uncharacterized integral membrane protein
VTQASTSGTGGTSRDRKRDTRVALIGAVAVLLVWFAAINLHDTEIHFWIRSARAPLLLVIVISAALGAGITALAMRRRHRGPN